MDERFFDDLSRGLNDGTISRRQALKLLGAALLGSALMPLFPRQAEAITTSKCQKKGGKFLSTGNCRCAFTCFADETKFHCHSNKHCTCWEKVDGTGFCGRNSSQARGFGCPTEIDCPTGYTCVVNPGCAGSGTSCNTDTDCPSPYSCLDGTCQSTTCVPRC